MSFRTVKERIGISLLFLKYDCYSAYSICTDIIAYDRPLQKYRFTIIYYLLSLSFNTRGHLLTQLADSQKLDTACMIYKSLN